jgi:hypothetical protein
MGIGNSKNPSFQLSEKCIGVRLGGMGVAGSLIGTELADLYNGNKNNEETNQETGKKESINFIYSRFYLKCCCGSLLSFYFVVLISLFPPTP